MPCEEVIDRIILSFYIGYWIIVIQTRIAPNDACDRQLSHASLGAETCLDIFISIISISNVKAAYDVKISLLKAFESFQMV